MASMEGASNCESRDGAGNLDYVSLTIFFRTLFV